MRRVLIANRGEIACRVIRTLDRLGIESVAVYTDVDRESAHCDLATVAVPIGPATGVGYRGIEQLLAVAEATGADAVHPGYGFLSENSDAAAAFVAAGLTWIGPTPEQIRRFGHKDEARGAAAAVGVPLPAGTPPFTDVDAAVAAAGAVGFPLLVKSVAGGGGIGMLPCADPDDLHAVVAQAMQQSAQAFGNPAVFLERLITRARHVEVQVFGDGRGRVVTLGEPRLLRATTPPEGGRGGAGPRHHRCRPAPRWRPRGARTARTRVLPLRRHRRVRPRRRHRRVPLPRGEHPPAGRAHRHRDDPRHRPRGVDGAARRRRRVVPRRRARACGARDPGPRVRGGPGARLRAQPGPGHRGALAGRRARRHLGAHRHRRHPVLRPAARQGGGAGADPRRRGRLRSHPRSRPRPKAQSCAGSRPTSRCSGPS